MRHTSFFIGFRLTTGHKEWSRVAHSFLKFCLTCQDSLLQQARSVLLCNWATRLNLILSLELKQKESGFHVPGRFLFQKIFGLLPLIVSLPGAHFHNNLFFVNNDWFKGSALRPFLFHQKFSEL